MSEAYLEYLHKLSWKSRSLIEVAGVGSCFDCFSYVDYNKINQWTDNQQTAICPHCSIDSIIPGYIHVDTLTEMHDKYFTYHVSP